MQGAIKIGTCLREDTGSIVIVCNNFFPAGCMNILRDLVK